MPASGEYYPHKKCLSFSPEKADCSLCLQAPNSKVFLGTRECGVTSDPFVVPSSERPIHEWTRQNHHGFLWQRRKQAMAVAQADHHAVLLLRSFGMSKFPSNHPRPVYQLYQSCLESALPWIDYVDILASKSLPSLAPTGKGQFSFQSQRRAVPNNIQTTIQLCSSCTLVRLCSKSFKLGFSSTWIENFQMYKLGLEKAEEPEIKLPTFVGL